MGQFRTVVVDPPWPMAGFGLTDKAKSQYGPHGHGWLPSALPYDSMSLSDIESIEINLVLCDDAFVFLWTTNKFLHDAFHVLDHWNLRYVATFTWVKPNGIQTPVSPKFNAEWCLLGRKGSPSYLDIKAFNTANFWPQGAISGEKPEGFYDLLRRVTPRPRLDIFGRRRIAGFDSWGYEAPDLPVLPDHYQEPML